MLHFSARSAVVLLVLPVVTGAVGYFGAWPVVEGRTNQPVMAIRSTEAAFSRASESETHTWAPEEFEQADRQFARARVEVRRQAPRWFFRRDYRAARALLAESRSRVERATEIAQVRRIEQGKRDAAGALDQAHQAVDVCTTFASYMTLTRDERRLLGQARGRLEEARQAHLAGDEMRSVALAREAYAASERLGSRCALRAGRYADAGMIATWRKMVRATIAQSARTGGTAIVIVKAARRLIVYRAGKERFTVPVDLGHDPLTDKLLAGDGATPEGQYRITARKDRGKSRYYKALLLDYPNDEDRREFEAARRRGLVSRRAHPGGLIEIHGEGGRGMDWTRGCIAVSNSNIDRIFAVAGVGTPVTIVGSDGGTSSVDVLIARYRTIFRNNSHDSGEGGGPGS